jgi:hypothetical protein
MDRLVHLEREVNRQSSSFAFGDQSDQPSIKSDHPLAERFVQCHSKGITVEVDEEQFIPELFV